MKGKWVHNADLDLTKWDALVERSPSSTIFSTSHYLNATCKDWFAYVDDDYSFGVPVGSKKKLGIQSIYPPYFHRYAEVIGDADSIDQDHFSASLKTQFPTGILHFKDDFIQHIPSKSFIFQVVSKEDYKLKSQAKRMLKKFKGTALKIEIDNNRSAEVLGLVKQELSKKMDVYAGSSSQGLDNLIADPPENIQLITVALMDQSKLVGGLIGLEYKQTVLYLKGTTTENTKKNGGMYALMDRLINYTHSSEKLFDFGGSRVEGVRFFNTRFNAQDKTYFCYHWDNSPGWYKFLKWMNQWRKK